MPPGFGMVRPIFVGGPTEHARDIRPSFLWSPQRRRREAVQGRGGVGVLQAARMRSAV